MLNTAVKTDNLKEFVPLREPQMQDFSERYKEDERYRSIVITQLRDIIESDVAAITINPVFGSLDSQAQHEVLAVGESIQYGVADPVGEFGRGEFIKVDEWVDARDWVFLILVASGHVGGHFVYVVVVRVVTA